ncbi:exosome complex component rrp45 isoform X2 [Nilaparvata lugens]|uniref:exosome complex component rrp45 isoform X2 n=1 Tax=Nilaparvata lugens TaxID=108931 RepID=UPI00193E4C9D|nr:exosome complex component rrp45 isoform X2 [Nilaparvata lugens]
MMSKDSLFSKYEKNFVYKSVTIRKRIDGRGADEYRKLDIAYGKEWGSCIVSLGETKVLATVTCDVQEPKATRPSEGLLFMNVEISPMAIPNIEQSTLSEMHTNLSRLLEKCIKESHCVDLEALCIVAEEKVWNVRVDMVVLNHEGNLVGCCSVAALSALAHFRRPDVTVDGHTVIVHDPAERELVPLSLHHYPVAIEYAIFEDGDVLILSDPTEIEERTAQAQLVLGMNAYRELCGMHLMGSALLSPDVIINCSRKAAEQALVLVTAIKKAVEEDQKQRDANQPSCLVQRIRMDQELPGSQSRSMLPLNREEVRERVTEIIEQVQSTKITKSSKDDDVVILSDDEVEVVRKSGPRSAETFSKKKNEQNPWKSVSGADSKKDADAVKKEETKTESSEKMVEDVLSSDEDDVALVREFTTEDRIIGMIELSGDSEEEEIVTMRPKDLEAVEDKRKGKIKQEEDKV